MAPIKNYTTDKSAAATAGEIQSLLARKGIRQISTEYDDDGRAIGLSFVMKTEYGVMSYSLPVNVDGVLAVLVKDPKVTRSQSTREQAEKTAWRNVKDWIDAQVAMIESGLGSMDQVMLPYLSGRDDQGFGRDDQGNQITMYERWRSTQKALEA